MSYLVKRVRGKPSAKCPDNVHDECVKDPKTNGCLSQPEGVFKVGSVCYSGRTMHAASSTVPITAPLEGVAITDRQVSEFAKFADASVALHQIEAAEAKAYPHCSLNTHQLVSNVVVPTLTLGVFAVPAHLGGPIAAALAAVAPVPLWTIQPYVTKVTYTMGFLHARETGAEESKFYERENRGVIPNISPFGRSIEDSNKLTFKVNNGTYVWGLLSYGDVNRVRITVFGESFQTPIAFQAAGGSLITYIEEAIDHANGIAKPTSEKLGQKLVNVKVEASKDDGTWFTEKTLSQKQVTLVICHTPLGGGDPITCRLAVGPLDGVQFVSCGSRPYFSKYHLAVDDNGVISCSLKHSEKTWLLGVAREDAVLEARAAGFGVQTDGVSVPRVADLPPDHNARSAYKAVTNGLQKIAS